MTSASDDEGSGNFFKRLAEFMKTETLVHKKREIVITREMLETASVWDILEAVSVTMNGAETGDQAEAILSTFSLGQRRLYAVSKYQMEVGHGGHEYYYRYSGGLVWPEALAGLEMIGATTVRDIFVEAMKRFPEGPSREFTPRQEALEKLGSLAFDDLDDRFYEVGFQLDDLMEAYIRAHPEEFIHSRTVDMVERPNRWTMVGDDFIWIPKE